MVARGSALWPRAILLAMVGITGSLLGCMAEIAPSPEERTDAVESALDPSDPAAPTPGDDPNSPGEPKTDPEPQPWLPGTPIIIIAHRTHSAGPEVEDPEPQPWQPGTPSNDERTNASASTKQH